MTFPQRGQPSRAQLVVQQQTFAGPIPPPSVLQEYERVLPGAAERIVKMAESQGEHRRGIEKLVMETARRDSLLGIISGFVVSLGFLAAAVYAIHQGHPAAAAFIGTTTVGALAGVFVYGTRARSFPERKPEGQQSS